MSIDRSIIEPPLVGLDHVDKCAEIAVVKRVHNGVGFIEATTAAVNTITKYHAARHSTECNRVGKRRRRRGCV